MLHPTMRRTLATSCVQVGRWVFETAEWHRDMVVTVEEYLRKIS